MAISKKNKNRVTVNDVEYLWWVFDETDQTTFDGVQVKIVCSDQSHFIQYGLNQPENNRKLALALRDYAKLVHLASPPFFENDDGIITKSGISRIIKWCKNTNHEVSYALIYSADRKNNNLSVEEKKKLLEELQNHIK